jgi:broad specificity phosphatase PhoE
LGQLLFVRHAQTSFESYEDLLSPLGWEQGRLLGEALARRVTPTVVVRGAMRRHRETAEATMTAAGWDCTVVEDDGWNEDDHLARLDVHPSTFGDRQPTREEFQGWLEAAADRWTSGMFDDEYAEPWAAFTGRVDAALRRAAELVEPTGTGIVFTSGGPLAWTVATLLCDETTPEARTALWNRLNRVVLTSSVTKITVGGGGLNLVSFNEHSHLEGVGTPGAVRTPAG